MGQPGSEAVGIGAGLFASAERWRPTLEAWRAPLRVATITVPSNVERLHTVSRYPCAGALIHTQAAHIV